MRPNGLAAAIMACLIPMAHAAFPSSPEEAQAAMQSYLDRNPISTVSAAQSQSTQTDLESLKAAVMAGDFTPSRSWEFLRDRCPGSCTSLGVESSSGWPVFSSMNRLLTCDQTMLLNFALYNDIDGTSGHVKIRGCTADLETERSSSGKSSCKAPEKSKSVTTSLQLGWDSGAATGSASEAVDALEQLLAYESMDLNPCNETINFAYSGKTSVGIYMGSGLHSQGLLPSILEDLIDRVQEEGVTETTVIQLCDSRTSRYSMGVIINSNGDLPATQMAVQSWRDTTCLTTLDNVNTWNNLTYSVPVASNSTSSWTRRDNGATKLLPRGDTCTAVQVVGNDTCTTVAAECGITLTELESYNPSTCSSPLAVGAWMCCTSGSAPDYAPSPDADGNCYAYTIKKDDTCEALAATYTITVDDINNWNNDTWGWMGCNDLLADETICLSSGWPPMPAVISNAVCGPQVNGTATAPHGADLSILNECPLNACCDIWGQCGITAEFCTKTNSTTGAPGTAANNTNGCISNCGTQINVGSAPSETFSIGYFEGYDILQRTCLDPLITDIDTTSYTHIHMSFATLNADFSFNLSMIEDQLGAFQNLIGVKRIVTVGGWAFSTDPSTYDIFRQAVSTSENRATLISNTINFLNTYDLDGIDWDWEYPGEPDIPGIPADTTTRAEYLFLFLMELSEQMPSGKTLSTTAPSSYWYMKAYPIEAISQVVDYIVMMTYDLHGQWDWNKTSADPGCPLGGCLRSHVNLTETLSAMSMITKAGVPSNKVALGTANYARSFQMSEAGCYGPDCTFTGPDSGATPGKCTKTAGYISNWELYGIADDTSIYTYIDDLSNSNIMVWDDTQWAGFMDDSIANTRKKLYDSINFLGTAEWAVSLAKANSSSNSDVCEMYIDPTVWLEDSPVVTAEPGCMLIWPPMPLPTNTTIDFPPWPTNITYRSTGTGTMTYGSSSYTYASVGMVVVPTLIPLDPVNIDGIPVWYQMPSSGQTNFVHTPSITPPPFPITITPTVGGNTTVIGGTTSTVSGVSYSSGNYSYILPPWVGIFGGNTSVFNGTTLAPSTTTVTPHPYPTTTDGSTDTQINSVSTKYSSTSTGGGPKTSADSSDSSWRCTHYCHHGCPVCPPDSGVGGSSGGLGGIGPPGIGLPDISGGGGGGGGGGDGGSNDGSTKTDHSSTSTSSSSSTSESAAFTVFAMGTTYFADPVPTTDALEALEAFASSDAALMESLYGSEISFAETATNTLATVSATTTASTTSSTGFAYTYTESNGDVVACPTEILVDLVGNTYASTVCVSPTTISTSSKTTTKTATKTTNTPSTTDTGLPFPTNSDINAGNVICFSDYNSDGKYQSFDETQAYDVINAFCANNYVLDPGNTYGYVENGADNLYVSISWAEDQTGCGSEVEFPLSEYGCGDAWDLALNSCDGGSTTANYGGGFVFLVAPAGTHGCVLLEIMALTANDGPLVAAGNASIQTMSMSSTSLS